MGSLPSWRYDGFRGEPCVHSQAMPCSVCVCLFQVLGEDWRKTALDFQEKVHKVAVTILKALFIALGRDETIINDVHLPLVDISVL